jgi:hypothetical protein
VVDEPSSRFPKMYLLPSCNCFSTISFTLNTLLLTFAWDTVCRSCKPLCQSVTALHVLCVSACYVWKGAVGVHSSGSWKGRNWGGGVLNWDCIEDEDLIHLSVWLNPSDLLF